MKTTRQHLNSLPEVYRDMALEAIEKQDNNDLLRTKESKAYFSVVSSFRWDYTPEGTEFWRGIYEHLLYLNL